MAHLADDSSCAAGSCLDVEDHAAAQPFSETEQQLRMELLALQEQHQLQQQEVALLHAQVERLSMLQMDRSSDEGHAAAPSSTSTSGADLLQQQLAAAHAELQRTRSILDNVMQDRSAAVKAACDQRSGALRLLLAEQTRELQQIEQQRVAALELAAAKEEDCEAMRIALAAANTHILQLTAQQAPQHKPPAHTHAHEQHGPAHEAHTLSAHAHAHAHTDIASSSQESRQDNVLQELQLQLSVQRQQLEVANEQVKELVQHLALKHDQVEFAGRRAALLEQQLEEAHRKAVAAAAVPDAQRRRSCGSIAEDDSEGHPALSLEGAGIEPCQTHSPQPGMQQQHDSPQQQQQQLEPHSRGIAGSLSAALSNAASGFSLGAGPRGDDHEQPPRQQTPPPLSPFALARKFVADREADAMARLKDELREREQEVAGLAAANSRLEVQLEGLQTILVTRVSQATRLTQELKDATKQLRQAEAAAVSDHGVLQQQLEQLSEKVVGLQDALAAGKQREQQLEAQLAATRGKLAQVLEALVADAAALQQHKPAQYKLLVQEMPAALADVMATAAATAATPARASSRTSSSGEHAIPTGHTSIPALRAASMPNDTLGTLRNLQHPTAAHHTAAAAAAAAAAHLHHAGVHNLQHSSSSRQGPAGAVPQDNLKPFGLRSFMRSRTLSSADGAPSRASGSGSYRGAAAAGIIPGPGDSWGRCVSVTSVEVQPQTRHALSFTSQQGAGALAACAGSSGTATPKSAAAKLFDVFRKKGREQEEGEAAVSRVPPIAQSSRTTGSGEYNYVLLES